MNQYIALAIAVPVAYVIGSVSFGVLIGRVMRGVDIRKYGSGNTGATNVMRTLGPVPGVAVLLLDSAKGASVVFVARALSAEAIVSSCAALAVIVGHSWPVFGRFHGGKGVATGLGALSIIAPIGATCALLGLAVAAVTRYVSLGSIVGTATGLSALLGLIFTGYLDSAYLIFAVGGFAIIEARHWQNARRLVKGSENRFSKFARPRRAGKATERAAP